MNTKVQNIFKENNFEFDFFLKKTVIDFSAVGLH